MTYSAVGVTHARVLRRLDGVWWLTLAKCPEAVRQLTHARAVAVLTELVEAFGRRTFQKKLSNLVAQSGDVSFDVSPMRPIRHLEGRRELVFKAQRDILQQYGFSVDEEGVLALKTALRAHLANQTVAGLSWEARVLLRVPQIQLPMARANAENAEWSPMDGCIGTLRLEVDEFSFLASPEVTDATEEHEVQPLSPPAPTLAPPGQSLLSAEKVASRAASRASTVAHMRAAAEQRMSSVDIRVTNPADRQRMTVTVPRRGSRDPTVADVKAAIVTRLGESAVDPSVFQLVVNDGGGVYGTRPDTEIVRLDRVLALGVHMALGVA